MSFPFVYQNVFGGSNIYPSDVSYRALTLGANVQLVWPLETVSGNDNLATRIMDVSPTGLYTIFLPDARASGVGETILFNNVGSSGSPFLVNAFGGGQQLQVNSGQSVQVYLADNSTAQGSWRSVPFGVSTSVAQAAVLAGYGLRPNGQTLETAIPQFAIDQDTTLTASQRAALVNWRGANGTLSLPDPGSVGSNWYIWVRNSGNGASYGQLTLAPPAAIMIDGGNTKVLEFTESLVVICDGSNYYTVGYGQNAQFIFDYVSIPLPVTQGTYSLTGDYLNRIAYGFSGALTGDITVLVPASRQQYWVYNGTSGAFNFYVASTSTPTIRVQVIAGQRAIVYCDGNQVVRANDNNVPVPIPVVQGGTGSVTGAGALVNFGGSPIGTAVFTATTQAQAQAALGIVDQTALTVALILALGG